MLCHRPDSPQKRYGVGREFDYVLCPSVSIRRHINKELCEDCHYYVNFRCNYREMYNPLNNKEKKQ